MEEITQLALMLWNYECDGPHFAGPTWGAGDYYGGTLTPEKLLEGAAKEHDGDCVGQPVSCIRCQSEEVLHKARWLWEQGVRLEGA